MHLRRISWLRSEELIIQIEIHIPMGIIDLTPHKLIAMPILHTYSRRQTQEVRERRGDDTGLQSSSNSRPRHRPRESDKMIFTKMCGRRSGGYINWIAPQRNPG